MKTLFKEAHEKINKEEAFKEELKVGTLRAGSSGALVGNSQYYTQCGRLAQARFLGYQSRPTQEMRLMFNGGLTLEDYFESRLKANNIKYKKEESIQVQVEGIKAPISGRPDYEIELDGKWVGVEIKSLASPFSVIKQRKNGFPFMKHLLQAATYMMLTNRTEWLVVIGHSFYVNQNGKKHEPELVWYEVGYDNLKSKFWVKNEKEQGRELPFDKSHIIAYYKEVEQKTEAKELMARPTELELNVDTYDRCKYCPMASACNEYEDKQISFEQWLARVLTNKEKNQE